MKVVNCGWLFDGDSANPISNGSIVIEEGRISEVGPSDTVSAPNDYEVIDYSDKFVIPGLIDAHVHLAGERTMDSGKRITERMKIPLSTARAVTDLRKLTAAGFTTVRDVGSALGIGLGQAVSEGSIVGPRIYSAGPTISQTAGHGDKHDLPYNWMRNKQYPMRDHICDGVDECRREVRKRIRSGADLIKIFGTGGIMGAHDKAEHSHFSDEELNVIVEEAHRVGNPVATHAISSEGVNRGLDAGVDTIEHSSFVNEDTLERIQKSNVPIIPTLSILYRIKTDGEKHNIGDGTINRCSDAFDQAVETIEKAHELGISIGLGTDFNGSPLVPMGQNNLEAEIYVNNIGMDELAAIKSATCYASQAIPDDSTGGIKAGNYADFVILNSNPAKDIENLNDVHEVYKDGSKQDIELSI